MFIKCRIAIDTILGHLKLGYRLDKNYLKGKEEDKINAMLSGYRFNIKKLLRVFILPFLNFV